MRLRHMGFRMRSTNNNSNPLRSPRDGLIEWTPSKRAKAMRLIKSTLASWQHEQRQQALISGWQVEFFRHDDDMHVAVFTRDGRVIDKHEWRDER